MKSFNLSFPKVAIKNNYANKYNWVNKGIINSIKQKNILFYLSKANPTMENISKYKTYKNKLTSILRNTERNYFTKQLELNKSDLKKHGQ